MADSELTEIIVTVANVKTMKESHSIDGKKRICFHIEILQKK